MVLGFPGYFWPILEGQVFLTCLLASPMLWFDNILYLTFGMSYAVVILYLQMVPEFPAGLNPPSSQSPQPPSYPDHIWVEMC